MTGADALDTVELPDLLDFCWAAACFCSRLVSCACCNASVPVVRPSGIACQQPVTSFSARSVVAIKDQ